MRSQCSERLESKNEHTDSLRALARAGIGAGSATADLSEFLLADRRASAGKLDKGSEVKV
jgi:hypothetical protein